MKKIIIALTTVFCVNSSIFAQDFYVGLKTGLKVEKHSKFFTKYNSVSAPALQMVFRTTFPKKWEIETGLGWYNYSQKVKAKIDSDIAFFLFAILNGDFPYTLSTSNEPIYGCVFLPLKAGYRFTLSPKLHLRLNTGLQLGLLYNARSTSSTLVESDPFELYVIYRGVEKPYLNLLFSNAVSLQYTTKFNMYISIFASYHAGLFDVYQSEVYLANRKSSESFFYGGEDFYIAAPLTTKGSYFEFGIELGYTWKKKAIDK